MKNNHTTRDYKRSLARSRTSRQRHDRPDTFTLNDREWDLLDDVFAPPYSPSTHTALRLLDLTPGGQPTLKGSFLEIGTGTGVIAVTAALSGCRPVVATDINPAAVHNTTLNAARHNVSSHLRALHSDLFSALGPQERFDTVYWHSNFVLAPSDYRYQDPHEQAYVDPGYAAHIRYLNEAPRWLTPGGRVLLHFSSRGDLPYLRRHLSPGNDLVPLSSVHVEEGPDTIHYTLLQLTTTPPAP